MDERRTIIDVVNNDPKLQNIIRELKEKKFLIEGVFNPQAYLRDVDKIKAAWKKEKSLKNAIALGASLYNDLFYDGMNQARITGDFKASRKTKNALEKWKKEVESELSSDYEEIEDIAGKIGQYLEFMNRKSQGY